MSADFYMMSLQSSSTSGVKKIAASTLLWFLFIQVAVVTSTFALDPQKTFSQYIHTNWQIEDGLPQNAVQCIIQTRDGYIWCGTQEGLARFDGVRFTVFNKVNTKNGIKHNSVRSLLEAADGSIWAGTEDGLTQMRGGKFVTYTKEDGLASNIVTNLYEDTQERLWIATEGGGLSVWKEGKFVTYTMKDGLASNHVTSVTGRKGRNYLHWHN